MFSIRTFSFHNVSSFFSIFSRSPKKEWVGKPMVIPPFEELQRLVRPIPLPNGRWRQAPISALKLARMRRYARIMGLPWKEPDRKFGAYVDPNKYQKIDRSVFPKGHKREINRAKRLEIFSL
jgi:hypothetical protein